MFDQNGVPAVTAGKGIFVDTEVRNRIVGIETPQMTFGNLVGTVLAEMDDEAAIVIDPANRQIYAFKAADVDVIGTTGTIAHTADTKITPEAGQEGRSLTWETADTGTGVPNKADLIAPTEAAKPRRTVESLISAVLSAYGQIDPAPTGNDVPLIAIDQEDGVVALIKATNRATSVTALDSAVTAAVDALKLTLSEPSVEGAPAPLVFEGGAVPA